MKCRRSSEKGERALPKNSWFAGKALARKKTPGYVERSWQEPHVCWNSGKGFHASDHRNVDLGRPEHGIKLFTSVRESATWSRQVSSISSLHLPNR